MALSVSQQALAAITRSNHTLVCFPESASADGVATALGLALALERQRPGHQIDVVSSGFTPGHALRYGFLPGVDRVQREARCEQKVRIRIPCDDPHASDLRHRVRDGAVEIELTTGGTALQREHIASAIEQSSYDLIIAVDSPDLASLGALYTRNPERFQGTPIIAIDHAPDHERYGQIHCIDVTASACGEVAAALLRELGQPMDADVATCFLTGILVKTRSFRTPRMGAQTFTTVSYLLECGARREEVVARLFQTKSIPELQLWGRALTRLRTDRERGLVWSILSQHDVLTVGAHDADLDAIVDDLLANAPDARVILLLCEQPDRTITVRAYAPSGRFDVAALLRPIGGTGAAARATATLPAQPLAQAEAHVLDVVRGRM
ncbi:MAG: hypothetical protein Q7S96_00610 [bacterium]|nr:hypothetical protein [bacterium]